MISSSMHQRQMFLKELPLHEYSGKQLKHHFEDCDMLQKAVSIIHAWPYYPLSLELASALAQQRGSPSAADLLNLRINQPGSSGLRTSSASLGPRT